MFKIVDLVLCAFAFFLAAVLSNDLGENEKMPEPQ